MACFVKTTVRMDSPWSYQLHPPQVPTPGSVTGAIADYARQREQTLMSHGIHQLGFFAHELWNLLHSKSLAFDVRTKG